MNCHCKGSLEVGKKVQCDSTDYGRYGGAGYVSGHIFKITRVTHSALTPGNICCAYGAKDGNGVFSHALVETADTHVIRGTTSTSEFRVWDSALAMENVRKLFEGKFNSMNNLKSTFALINKPEPMKSFIKAGVADAEGNFTAEGRIVFFEFLLQKFGDEFKTTVIDPVIAEQKADAAANAS